MASNTVITSQVIDDRTLVVAAHLIDCEISNAGLLDCTLERCIVRNTTVTGCRFDRSRLSGSSLRSCRELYNSWISHCRLSVSTEDYLNHKKLHLYDCNITDSDMASVQLVYCQVSRCHLAGTARNSAECCHIVDCSSDDFLPIINSSPYWEGIHYMDLGSRSRTLPGLPVPQSSPWSPLPQRSPSPPTPPPGHPRIIYPQRTDAPRTTRLLPPIDLISKPTPGKRPSASLPPMHGIPALDQD